MKILLIEDNPGDARLVQEALREGPGDFTIHVAERLGLALQLLASQDMDVALLDLGLPDSNGLETLTGLRTRFPDLPVVIMTGLQDEELGAQALQLGAQDYLVKGQIVGKRLHRTLTFAIERKHTEEVLLEHQEKLRLFNETLEQKVQEQTAEVRQLASDLIKAEQRERQRISHVLHDDLQQRVYAIQMQMLLLQDDLKKEDEAIRRDFAEIKDHLDEVLAVMRHLSIDLSPPVLQNEGLSHALAWLASHMQEQHGLGVELQADECFAIPDEELQMFLFNCVRELLFNVVKHAGVKRARVALRRSGGCLRIEVQDQGKGFESNAVEERIVKRVGGVENVRTSYGLPTMQHQLSLLGGKMDIKSAPGAGTQVILTVPVNEGGTG